MYHIGICSNDRTITGMLQRLAGNQNLAEIYAYASENELWDEMITNVLQLDLLFISLGDGKCIEIVRELQKRRKELVIIYLLESTTFILEMFDLEPAYFLLKPVDENSLHSIIVKMIQKLEEKKPDMLQLCFKNRMIKIPYAEILYIESDGRYIIIHYSEKKERVRMKLDDVLEHLPDYFVRCHQSYVVNTKNIMRWEKNMIYIGPDSRIPVSRSRMQIFKEKIYGNSLTQASLTEQQVIK